MNKKMKINTLKLFIIHYSLFIIAAVLLQLPSPAAAQEANTLLQLPADNVKEAQQGRPTIHATLIGVGGVHQLDTYLSPLEYHGPQGHFMHETLRRTHWADGRISVQTLWHGNFAYTKNATEKGVNLGGDIRFDAAWRYSLRNQSSSSPFRLLIGPQIGTTVGALYSTRNGNNPVQAIASVHLSASAIAFYNFRLWRQPFTARYQLDVPLIGAKFSPNYGQSYYEIFSLGHYDHNVCVTHPFNAFSSRHLLTIDVPLPITTLRFGYLCDLRQSKVNELKYHNYSHAFMIGIVRYLTIK